MPAEKWEKDKKNDKSVGETRYLTAFTLIITFNFGHIREIQLHIFVTLALEWNFCSVECVVEPYLHVCLEYAKEKIIFKCNLDSDDDREFRAFRGEIVHAMKFRLFVSWKHMLDNPCA
jgi:hypothetical protein